MDSASRKPAITIRALVKQFHIQPVLNQLSLTLEDGDFCVLVGANGAGKTTLLRILATLSRPTQGQVLIHGVPLHATPTIRQTISYISHQSMFYEDLTALQNLRHYAKLYDVNQAEKKIAEGIRASGLKPFQNRPVRTFSRGMQQRLSIERALLHDPKILLLDEPYTGLDQEAAQLLDQRLQDLHTSHRVILVAAHQPQRLIPIASYIAWLQNGVISHHLPTSELKTSSELLAYLQEAP
jgi:heme ABC exporter ATP-binding subunit CcmA